MLFVILVIYNYKFAVIHKVKGLELFCLFFVVFAVVAFPVLFFFLKLDIGRVLGQWNTQSGQSLMFFLN